MDGTFYIISTEKKLANFSPATLNTQPRVCFWGPAGGYWLIRFEPDSSLFAHPRGMKNLSKN